MSSNLTLRWKNSQAVPLDDLTPEDAKRCLQHIVRNASYHNASFAQRKDLAAPTGVLDYDLTTLFIRHSKTTTDTPFPATTFFENQLVGAPATKDRLCAAKLAEDSTCRFCKNEKESMNHLVDCPGTQEILGAVPDHKLGPNFRIFGIVEHPAKIAEHRLRWSPLPEVISMPFLAEADPLHVWTDGSVIWNDVFWITAGGYAVANEFGTCVAKGPVTHWALSSYTAELWALLVAVALTSQRLQVFTDSQTVANQFKQMVANARVDPHWSHQRWWRKLFAMWNQRLRFVENPIEVIWIAAHCFEHIPIECITEDMAAAKKTTIYSSHSLQ